MNVLLLGSGGRENAFAWKLAQSELLTQLYIAPGNGGSERWGTNLPINPNDFEAVKSAVLKLKIDMVIVGPEEPLVRGIKDFFLDDSEICKIPVIGPGKLGATLEGSKEFAKDFMLRHNIPTAKYFTVTQENISEGVEFLDEMSAPYVLKADGLAAGKGVLIIHSLEEAKSELKLMLDGKFGAASKKVVIEECMTGIELSVFVLTDGFGYVILPEAKDYKRIGEGDTGLNTGGMGAISPVPFADKAFMQKVEEKIVIPTLEGLRKDDIPYKGFIFLGLFNTDGEPRLIEYNVRMGDPETEAVMLRIKSDLLQLFVATANYDLKNETIEIDTDFATTVMMVSGGYPEEFEKGKAISGLENVEGSIVFHAGTTKNSAGVIQSAGGRVLAVSSKAKTMKEALELSFKNVAKIQYDGSYYRRDIGFDLIK